MNSTRFSYVRNNPLKYTDPSGYNYTYWNYSTGTFHSGENGNNANGSWDFFNSLDQFYGRGQYALDKWGGVEETANKLYDMGARPFGLTKRNGKLGVWIDYFGTKDSEYTDTELSDGFRFETKPIIGSKFTTIEELYGSRKNRGMRMGGAGGSWDEQTQGGVDAMDIGNYVVSNSGTLAGGSQYGVNSMSNKQQWKYSYKAHKYLKGKGANVQTRAIKHGTKGVLKNASRKITYVGGVLAVADVAIDGELRASHILNVGMVGVSAIPVAGWIIGGVYFAADMITLGVSGESIGQHLDNAIGSPIYNW